MESRTKSYGSPDLLGALYHIGREKSIGRISLSRKLGLGEQATRKLLRDLENTGLIKVQGNTKTLPGDVEEAIFSIRVQEILGERLVPGWKRSFLLQVCGGEEINIDKSLIELRDSTVRWGGRGAIILYYDEGKVRMPGGPGKELEITLERVSRNLDLKKCKGILVVVGVDEETIEWYPIFGFLRSLCDLKYTF